LGAFAISSGIDNDCQGIFQISPSGSELVDHMLPGNRPLKRLFLGWNDVAFCVETVDISKYTEKIFLPCFNTNVVIIPMEGKYNDFAICFGRRTSLDFLFEVRSEIFQTW
jgi:hypothetical protein